MKYILLASASAFAFAGAAAAEVTFSGEAELGYNDTTYIDGDNTDNNYGFYWSATLGATWTQDLNNGLTAGASFGVDITGSDYDATSLPPTGNLGEPTLSVDDYLVWLTSENAGMYFGTTDPAAAKHWVSVSGMEHDNFTTDAADYWAGDGAAVLRGDISYGGIDASVSYLVDLINTAEMDQLSVGAAGSFGNFNFSLAYQDSSTAAAGDDFNPNRVFGVSVGTTFAGADVTLAYVKDDGLAGESIGIEGSYPIGPVTVGAYYVSQTAGDGNAYGLSVAYASGPIGVTVYYDDTKNADADWGIDASYDVGNGLTVYAGVAGAGDAPYIAGEFDLGNGATLGLSWADDNAAHAQEDEIGAREYQEGATAWVSFTF